MRRRSSILYIPPTTFALPPPLLTSPLPSSPLTGWQQAVTPDSLPSQQREGHRICVSLGVYTYFFFMYVCVCAGALVRGVICVWTASRENIQPKIKTHLSASSGYVCECVSVCLCAHILCLRLCQFALQCFSEPSLRQWGLPSLCCEWWQTAQRGAGGRGREGGSASRGAISGF